MKRGCSLYKYQYIYIYLVKHSQPLLLKEFYAPEGSDSQFTTKCSHLRYSFIVFVIEPKQTTTVPVCR